MKTVRPSKAWGLPVALFLALQMGLGILWGQDSHARSEALNKLIEAGKVEGGTFIAHSLIDDVRGRQEVEAAMSKMFGFKIKWDHVDFPNQNRFAARLLKELNSGRPPSTDVFNGTQSTIPRLLAAKALEEVSDWQELLPRIPKEAIAPGGGALVEHSRIGGLAYNTNMVPADKVPQKLEDLLNPFWKGKLASTTYAAVWDRAGITEDGNFDEKKAARLEEVLKKLVDQGHIVGLIGCGDENRIASGEFGGLALICGDNGVRRAKAKGAPVEIAFLDETSNISHSYVGLMKKAKYPNMGKLFMLFLQTPEGQALNSKWEHSDNSFYPENRMYKIVQDLRKRGVAPPYIDIATYVKVKPLVEKWKDRYKKLLVGKKSSKKQ